MKNFKFTWKNCGEMLLGFDIAKFTINLTTNNNYKNMSLITDTGMLTIEDKLYNYLNKENKYDVDSVFEKLANVSLPEQTNYDEGGFDGFAWELEIDDKKYSGYLITPDFLKNSLTFDVWAEIVNIIAWFFLWEATAILSLKTRDLRHKRNKYLSYISIKVEYQPLEKKEN